MRRQIDKYVSGIPERSRYIFGKPECPSVAKGSIVEDSLCVLGEEEECKQSKERRRSKLDGKSRDETVWMTMSYNEGMERVKVNGQQRSRTAMKGG